MTLRGVRLELHPSPDWVSDDIRRRGDFYEIAILEELGRRVTGGVLVDAGAMIGNHTAYLAAFVPHTAIHAFEPAPVNLELLRRNVAPYPSVTVHPVALSSRPGPVRMSVHRTNRGHAVVDSTDPWPEPDTVDQVWDARAIALDSLMLEDVALLKVDVEWHEPEVLAGARETIDRCHPLIVIEDWKHVYGDLLPGYRLAAEWETAHQTFLYEWTGPG